MHPAIVKGIKALRYIFDSLEVGKVYDFEVGKGIKPWATRRYRVKEKYVRGEWSYCVLCEGVDGRGIIYLWIVQSHVDVERIIHVKEVK